NELEVLLNDSDPDGQALAVNSIASLATNGTAYVSGGRLFYGPNPANNLIHDFFSYSVADTYGALATGTVSIAILPSKYAIVTPIYTTNQIVSPTNQVETTSPVTITGIASSDIFDATWRLDYRLRTDGAAVWVPLSSGTTNVNSGTLGTFDPTTLRNGIYEVRLTTFDVVGTKLETSITIRVVQGATKVGQFTLAFTDLQIPVSGLPITLTRTYDSRNPEVGDFGVGWNLDVNSVHLEKSGIMGQGWTSYLGSGFAGFAHYVQESEPHLVTVTFPDDKTFRFYPVIDLNGSGQPWTTSASLGKASAAISFAPFQGTVDTIRTFYPPVQLRVGFVDVNQPVTLNEDRDATDEQGTNTFGPLYDPSQFEFTTLDGRRF